MPLLRARTNTDACGRVSHGSGRDERGEDVDLAGRRRPWHRTAQVAVPHDVGLTRLRVMSPSRSSRVLAYYVQWHLERAWASLLIRDEEWPEPDDPIAPAQRSVAALAKAHTGRLSDGTPVHSLRTLLAEMGTLTRNLVVPAGAPDAAAFEITSSATSLWARTLALLASRPPA